MTAYSASMLMGYLGCEASSIRINHIYVRSLPMKRKYIIAILLIAFALAFLGIYFLFFDTSSLVFLDNEKVIGGSNFWGKTLVVSQKGDVYINSGSLSKEGNYGVKNVRQYNLHVANNFVQIYDGKDAVNANISGNGGCIVTGTHKVYLFKNDDEYYKTPQLLCEGYTQAFLSSGSTVHLLDENGDLGFIIINSPDDFIKIGGNVKKFLVVEKHENNLILALTDDHKLYFLSRDETLNDCQSYLDNIADFDCLVPHIHRLVFSLLDVDGNASYLMGDYDLTYESISDTKFTTTGKSIAKVASYDGGIAMIDTKNDLMLYGSYFNHDGEWSYESPDLKGESYQNNVTTVISGNNSFYIIKEDGSLICCYKKLL